MERKNTVKGAQFSHQTLYTLKLIFENAIFPELCVMFPTGMLRSIFFIFYSPRICNAFPAGALQTKQKTGSQTKKRCVQQYTT
jgi:hypothetical protein